MSSALDMSLDDIIKNSKKSAAPRGGGAIRGGGAVRGGGPFRGGGARGSGFGGSGPARRIPNWSFNRPAPYAIGGKAPDSAWQHDLFSEQLGGFGAPAAAARSAAGIETGTKLYISNLDYGVSNEDIKELFSEVGDLKRFSIHYDRSGRSKGTAEVVFSRRSDALAAVKRYNNVQLDGKLMKIEVVGTNISPPAVVPPFTNGGFGNPNGFPRSVPAIPGPARGGFIGVPRGGGRIRGRGGRGRGRGRGEPVSAADLDADLDKYHHESMQIS